ncbi:hypothetical protein ACHAWX_007313, partial [Stephanocyclus meneghinianus]
MIIEHLKCTSDSDSTLRYYAHKQEAKSLFARLDILLPEAFEEVAWKTLHKTLHSIPKMFQLFAGKQVYGVSAVLGNLSKQKEFAHLGDRCPNCSTCKETTRHLLLCREIGRIKCLTLLIRQVSQWMRTVDTAPELSTLISEYLFTRGSLFRDNLPIQIPQQYTDFIRSQDKIGWNRMMEGMLSKELLLMDSIDVLGPSCKISQLEWVQTLMRKLLEATHGVWIYRNITVHNKVAGFIATKKKEQLLKDIETQIELGGEGLADHDKWMLEVDLELIESSS